MTTPRQPILRTIRHVNTIDIDAFIHDLIDEPLISHPPADLDQLVLAYNNTLAKLLDQHTPLIHKRVSSRPPSPWFTPLLSCPKATCRRFERAWRSSKTTFNLNHLRHATNLYHHTIIKSKSLTMPIWSMIVSHIPANCGKPSTIFFTGKLLVHFLPLFLNHYFLVHSHPFSPIKSLNRTHLSPLKTVPCPSLILIHLVHRSHSILFVWSLLMKF